jgi:ribosome-binding protein aMBF1 (putative translation factor)
MKDCSINNKKMQDIYKQIGINVRNARKQKEISQLVLALAIGHKAVGTISMAEICHNAKHFNLEHLYKIADVLEINVCDLLPK